MTGRLLGPAAFLLIGMAVCAGLYKAGEGCYAKYTNKKVSINNAVSRGTVKVMVLGTSHAKALRPRLLGYAPKDTLRDQLAGSDLYEAMHSVRTLLPLLPELEVVLMSVSYFSFGYDNSSYKNRRGINDRIENRRILYATHPGWSFLEGDFNNMLTGKLYPLITEDHWESVFRRWIFPGEARAREPGSLPSADANASPEKVEMLDMHGIERSMEVLEIMRSMAANNENIGEETLGALLEISERVRSHDVRLVLVTTPFWASYNNHFSAEHQNRMRNNVRLLQERYDVEYYDFSDCEVFRGRPEWFMNSDHLNDEGFKVFNRLLAKSMKNGAVQCN